MQYPMQTSAIACLWLNLDHKHIQSESYTLENKEMCLHLETKTEAISYIHIAKCTVPRHYKYIVYID